LFEQGGGVGGEALRQPEQFRLGARSGYEGAAVDQDEAGRRRFERMTGS